MPARRHKKRCECFRQTHVSLSGSALLAERGLNGCALRADRRATASMRLLAPMKLASASVSTDVQIRNARVDKRREMPHIALLEFWKAPVVASDDPTA